MISKYCMYSNTDPLMDTYLLHFFLAGEVPTVISVAMDIFMQVPLYRVVLVPKNFKRRT